MTIHTGKITFGDDLTLTITNQIPDGLLTADSHHLHELLGGPTLIHLPGQRPEPVFVSILLHGNEYTGLLAIQRLLSQYRTRPLPRALSLFIGNTLAAKHGHRRLDNQPDYNRVWPGADHPACAETAMMAHIHGQLQAMSVFASIDLHNNTGINPHYACVNRLEDPFMHLATLFGRTVVYFLRPQGVQSMAFSQLCPSVTLECGQPGQEHGTAHAAEFVDACLHLSHFPQHPISPHDIDLFHTVAIVRIPDRIQFGFADRGYTLNLPADLDHLNFRELPVGTLFGQVDDCRLQPLQVTDEQGNACFERYFHLDNGQLTIKREVMPSMLTLDTQIIRQDCLCYLMERMNIHPA